MFSLECCPLLGLPADGGRKQACLSHSERGTTQSSCHAVRVSHSSADAFSSTTMSNSPPLQTPSPIDSNRSNDGSRDSRVIEISLETAIKTRLSNLTDALLGAPEVADLMLPLVKDHLVAATDLVVPRAREQFSKVDVLARFTARLAVLLSPPPPLTDWILMSEAKRMLERDPSALSIWPEPRASLHRCARDVLSDTSFARPTCVRVLSDIQLLDALNATDAAGKDYVAQQMADHILKGDRAPRKAARVYAQRYAEQLGGNHLMRSLSLALRGYYVWTFARKALPIVVDLVRTQR